MKLYASVAPPGLLEERKRLGQDRFDEMWEGVVHMNAVPHRDHQELGLQLGSWLLQHWAKSGARKVFPERNIAPPGGWSENYRIPDLVLTTADRFPFDKGTHIEGPPLVVVEIHSPHDESYEKLLFYAQLGVPEVWIIDRDTKDVELMVLEGKTAQYQAATADSDGWFHSDAAGIQLKPTDEEKLAIQLFDDPQSLAFLPLD